MTKLLSAVVRCLGVAILLTSCSTSPPGPGQAGDVQSNAAVPPATEGRAFTTEVRVALPLPAAAPLTTFGPDGERVDPIRSLQALLESGEVTFSFDPETGYLASLLAALDIPVSSQGLVFSRTSLQTDRITPWSPRAVYFNDDIYVGYVQESSFLEIASIDPDDGAMFYTMDQNQEAGPSFQGETTTCLMCHDSRTVTGGVPGVMVRSVLTDRFGYVVTPLHEGAVTDRTPIEERLGGWYVTGTHANSRHAGNALAPELSHEIGDKQRYLQNFDMTGEGNVTSLEGRFDASLYLSGHSDLVALLVLSHQTRIHNLITLAHEAALEALREQDAVLRSTGRAPPEGGLTPAAEIRIDGAVDRLVKEMMFVREAPLGGPVAGTSGFAEDFVARGPRDTQGRSLRDFNLETRLFEFPLSFLVYSDAFDALPEVVKRKTFERIDGVLSGSDETGDYGHIDAAHREAIRQILLETKADFDGAEEGLSVPLELGGADTRD